MFFSEFYLEALIRLVAGIIIGGLIGFERAESGREAGIRTHMVLCMGAALVMITNEYMSIKAGMGVDVSRMGAQVVSGVSFLGVGCIVKNDDKIKGLTTAAGLWTTACIGLTVGIGFYDIAITATVLMLGALYILKPLVHHIQSKFVSMNLFVRMDNLDVLHEIIRYFESEGVSIKYTKADEHQTHMDVTFDMRLASGQNANAIILDLLEFDGVHEVRPIGI